MPELNFKGKSIIDSYHLGVPFRELNVDQKHSLKGGKNPSLDDNLIIHGDNLHALKALLPRYSGRIKCIYIDPPYNTGNEGWKYNDNVNNPALKDWLQKEVGVEDLEKHDKWLCMMWPRLQLLRDLLSEDGVLFVSLDDNEVHRCALILDEIFGEENFVGSFPWKSASGGRQDSDKLASIHNYILCYAQNKESIKEFRWPISDTSYPVFDEARQERYKLQMVRKWGSNSRREDRPNLYYGVKWGDIEIFPKLPDRSDGCWRWSKPTMEKQIKNNNVILKHNKANEPVLYEKVWEKQRVKGSLYYNWLDSVGTTADGTKELDQMGLNFPYPKPSTLVEHLIRPHLEEEDIVLDSFAGSGTTAHAVLKLNNEDKGQRKFILIECEDYANSITAQRVRRVIAGVPNAKDKNLQNGLGGSFTYCHLGEEISAKNLLKGENLPSYETLAKYVFYTATGQSIESVKENQDYFVSKCGGDTAVFVIYRPDRGFLKSKESALNLSRQEKVMEFMRQKKCHKGIVFAPACFLPKEELAKERLVFCQLPFDIHRIAG